MQFQLKAHFLESSLHVTCGGDWHREPEQEEAHKIFNYRYLWPIRGGFGCINWLDALVNGQGLQTTAPPTLIGYSDITTWHSIWHRHGWGETYYAFMPGGSWGTLATNSLSTCLSGQPWQLQHVEFPETQCLRPGIAHGPSFAACLRVLTSLIGTPAQPDLRGHILALEDIDERPYALERDMQQLYRAGALSGITALVIGTMPFHLTDPTQAYYGPTVAEVFRNWGERLDVPVIQGLPFGHVADPLSLPIGRSSSLQVDVNNWTWSFAAR